MRKFYFLLSLSLCAKLSIGQLSVKGGYTATQLVNKLVGNGVTVSNVQFIGYPGAIGTFNGVNSDIGLDSGVLITTGNILYAPGPNWYTDAGDDNFLDGDPDLTALSGDSTYDASILEFDFIPQYNTVKFRYVFASEEYPEFVCSSVNDIFAFFISGPGITGKQNIALIPNTNIPVSINTLNSGIPYGSNFNCNLNYSMYYLDNEWPYGNYVEYDGFTTVLTAQATVVPGSTYHIRLAIADGGDGVWDSGVFLEAGSFTGTSSVLPVADFQASDNVLCENDCISFTDKSTNATSWKWSFPGALPNTSTDQNPAFVCYFASGVYNASLIAYNAAGSDTTVFTNYIDVKASPPVPVINRNGNVLSCTTDPSYIGYQWYLDNVLIPGATNSTLIISQDGNYNVSVENANGCKVAVGINIVLGLHRYTEDINIAKTGHHLLIHATTDWINARYSVLNTLGQTIIGQQILSVAVKEIDIAALAKGVYFVRIEAPDKTVMYRFAKE